jgi:hypothetical protein
VKFRKAVNFFCATKHLVANTTTTDRGVLAPNPRPVPLNGSDKETVVTRRTVVLNDKTWKELMKKSNERRKRLAVRYSTKFGMPAAEPKAGRALVHNHVMHTVDMSNGVNGFRAWTQKMAPDLMRCRCGWSGLTHYRRRGLGSGKAVTEAQLAAALARAREHRDDE